MYLGLITASVSLSGCQHLVGAQKTEEELLMQKMGNYQQQETVNLYHNVHYNNRGFYPGGYYQNGYFYKRGYRH